jgi:hypothetical protein|nr:MAG TPA: Protein of unknown function (DUF1642) [Caudoviricetes sp.]
MNKRELENHYTELLTKYPFGKIEITQVLEDLKKIDEPEKVVIPQFVAGWLNYCKLTGVDLYHAFEMGDLYLGNYAYQKDYPKLKGYFESENNQDIFARAWLDGYEVEKEKRYIVKFKNVQKNSEYLKYDLVIEKWYFGMNQYFTSSRLYHTKEELEKGGFEWLFSCEGVEIEEIADE